MQSNLAEDEDYGPWTFADAPEDVRAAILDKQRYFEVDNNDWWDLTDEDFKAEMEEKGIHVNDMWFSGFCCQGDGASFDGYIEDLPKFLEAYYKAEDFATIRKLLNIDGFYFSFKCDSRSHDRCSFEYDYEDWRYLIDYDQDDLRYHAFKAVNLLDHADDEIHRLAQEAEDIFKREMCGIYRTLEKEHDYLTSNEHLTEYFEGADYLFDEDGDMV